MASDWKALNHEFQKQLAAKDYPLAERLAQDAIARARTLVAESAGSKPALANLVRSYTNFAALRICQGQWQEARASLDLATTLGLGLGLEHPALLATLRQDVALCRATGELEQAQGLLRLIEAAQLKPMRALPAPAALAPCRS